MRLQRKTPIIAFLVSQSFFTSAFGAGFQLQRDQHTPIGRESS